MKPKYESFESPIEDLTVVLPPSHTRILQVYMSSKHITIRETASVIGRSKTTIGRIVLMYAQFFPDVKEKLDKQKNYGRTKGASTVQRLYKGIPRYVWTKSRTESTPES